MSAWKIVGRIACALTALAFAGPALAASTPAGTDDASCLECHKQYSPIGVGNPPSAVGCADCHRATDGRGAAHTVAGRFAASLGAGGAASCMPCHQKDAYTKLRHGKLGAGCDGCHSVHSPKHGTLKNKDTAALCYTCHDRRGFASTVTHDPVAKGDCTDCHEVHATDHPGLLSGAPGDDCAACHKRAKSGPHAGTSSLSDGHPVGGEKTGLRDPAHPGRPYQCVSCHDPHSSDRRGLIRLPFVLGLCRNCHPH